MHRLHRPAVCKRPSHRAYAYIERSAIARFPILVYSDKPIVVQMLDEEDRKL